MLLSLPCTRVPENPPEGVTYAFVPPCTRVPEIVFQPMMVGVDQSGVTETLDFVLHKYSPDIQQRLVNVGAINCTVMYGRCVGDVWEVYGRCMGGV